MKPVLNDPGAGGGVSLKAKNVVRCKGSRGMHEMLLNATNIPCVQNSREFVKCTTFRKTERTSIRKSAKG